MPESYEVANQVRIAVIKLSRRFRTSTTDTQLSAPHLNAIGNLYDFGPMTLQELSDRERISAPSMSRTVKALIALGYVERAAHPDDGRKSLLKVTDDGFGMLESTRQLRNNWLAERIDHFTPDERDTLVRASELLRRLTGD